MAATALRAFMTRMLPALIGELYGFGRENPQPFVDGLLNRVHWKPF